MANEELFAEFDAFLTQEKVSEAFEVVRQERPSLVSLVPVVAPETPSKDAKCEWLNSTRLAGLRFKTTAAVTNVATTIPVVNASLLRKDTIVRDPSTGEQMIITAVDTGANTITVVRHLGGTTTAIADAATLEVVSVARPENSEGENNATYAPVREFNYFQTFDAQIEYSRRALSGMTHGNFNDLNFQLGEQMRDLVNSMDMQMQFGLRLARPSGQTMFGGIQSMVSDGTALGNESTTLGYHNAVAGAPVLTLAHVNDTHEQVFNRGGRVSVLMMNTATARKLGELLRKDNISYASMAQTLADASNAQFMRFDIPVVEGVNQILINSNMANGQIWFLNPGRMAIVPMAAGKADHDGNWTMSSPDKDRDGYIRRILGDYSFRYRNQYNDLALMTGVTV